MRQIALHQEGVDPAAVLIANGCQPPGHGKPARLVQRGGCFFPGVGDDPDHLPRAALGAGRQEPGEQEPAETAPSPAVRHEDRVLDCVPIARLGPPRPGIGVPGDVVVGLGDEKGKIKTTKPNG